MARIYTGEEVKWLRENYPRIGPRNALKEKYDRDFPQFMDRSGRSLISKAHKMGLYVHDVKCSNGRRNCDRTVRWSREHEMTAWMEEHDEGQRTIDLSNEFYDEFGFHLTQQQISSYRTTHGNVTKRPKKFNRWNDKPIGYERDTGKGYILTKVAEFPTKPGSKDNWRPTHHVVWEEHNGNIPDGFMIMHCDGDYRNNAIDNLMAVERNLIGVINSGECGEYHDRDTLTAVVGVARVKRKLNDFKQLPRKCLVCGDEFTPRHRGTDTHTCPKCLSSGRKHMTHSRNKHESECVVCGAKFHGKKKNQVRCQDCIDSNPRICAKSQKRHYERTGDR